MASKKEEGSAEKKGSGKTIILVVVGAVLLVAATGGVTLFLLQDKSAAAPAAGDVADAAAAGSEAAPAPPPGGPPMYFPITPAIVVNFEDTQSAQYMQVTLEVMSHNEDAIDAVRENLPAIRNSLLMLFSGQDADALRTRDGKEALRQLALTEIQKVVEQRIGSKGIEDVYFTSLVMQ